MAMAGSEMYVSGVELSRMGQNMHLARYPIHFHILGEGQGQYVDDLRLPGALHATFVRSPWAHARIKEVDVSEAAALPGVQAFTAEELQLGKRPPASCSNSCA